MHLHYHTELAGDLSSPIFSFTNLGLRPNEVNNVFFRAKTTFEELLKSIKKVEIADVKNLGT